MGVVTHSEPKKVFIFSTERTGRSQEVNAANHKHMASYFDSHFIPYVEIEGKYNGHLEKGFLVSAAAVPEEAVLFYARHYHQDEYMVLDNHKHGTYIASMVNCATQAARQVGFMRSMTHEDVMAMDLDYTYRPDVDKYFVVWHTDTTQMGEFEEEKETFFRKLLCQGRMPSSQEPFGTPAYS